MSTVIQTELDALLDRVREVSGPSNALGRSLRFDEVARDCLRMFEDLATRYKEEFAARDRYKAQSNGWRDKALSLADAVEWKPIETAPRDGEMILIAHNHWGTVNVTLAAWGRVNYGCGQFEDGWRSYSGFLTGAKWWCAIPSMEGLEGDKPDTGPLCIYPIGQTTCGYTLENHRMADGSPMNHLFQPTPSMVLQATNEHPAVYKTKKSTLVAGKRLASRCASEVRAAQDARKGTE